MPSFTIFKHHSGRTNPSFEIVERATAAEVQTYARGLMLQNDDYERLEIVHAASGYEEVVERSVASANPD